MKVAVIGDGGWGTALGMVLNRNGHAVSIWGPFPDYIEQVQSEGENRLYLPDVKLPESIRWTSDRQAAVDGAELIVLAVPTRYYPDVVSSFACLIPPTAAVVSVAKGLQPETHRRMSEVANHILNRRDVVALSGPSHAEEVARRIPTAVVLASRDPLLAAHLQSLFASPRFRVYTSEDVVGVELGGALKNVIAVAVGVSDGIGFGDNTKAALITRGLAEISRLGCSLGASPATFAGLSGMGDLIVTCASRLSRNRAVGERLGKGESIDNILGSMKQVAEGVYNCASARALAHVQGIDVPITEQVYSLIHEGLEPHEAVNALLERDYKPE